jgi:hypothetical protein
MPRKLDEKDLEILKKLAPECENIICSSLDHEFHSIGDLDRWCIFGWLIEKRIMV